MQLDWGYPSEHRSTLHLVPVGLLMATSAQVLVSTLLKRVPICDLCLNSSDLYVNRSDLYVNT